MSNRNHNDNYINNLKKENFVLEIDPNKKFTEVFPSDELNVVGISSKINTLPAYGGIVYSISVLGINLFLKHKKIIDQNSLASFKIDDIDLINFREILLWKQYIQTFKLIDQILNKPNDTNLIIIDIPFIIRRAQQLTSRHSSIIVEFEKTHDYLDTFWKKNLQKLFPYNKKGVVLCAIYSGINSNILNAFKNNNLSESCDEISEGLREYLKQNIENIEKYGFSRILFKALNNNYRTISYAYSDLKIDLRTEPKLLIHELNGFFLKMKNQQHIFTLEFLGHKHQWASKKLNELASKILELTWMNYRQALPIPLWYAKNLNKDTLNFLKLFKKSIKKEMR